ncbi:MAG: hypothetical protein ACLPR9_02030 [Acidimicrobiales bacterium]
MTTEQELKFAVVAEVVVVDATVVDDTEEAVVGLVAGAVLEDGDELHAARSIAAPMAATSPTTPGRSFGCALNVPSIGRADSVCTRAYCRGVITTG